MNELVTEEMARRAISVPGPDDNKYRRGVVDFVTGSARYPGAGVLGVLGAQGVGAGLIRYRGAAENLVLTQAPEVVCLPGRSNVSVIGSGWDDDLVAAVADCQAPVTVIDAGALERPALWRAVPSIVLTPHQGEAARLLGETSAAVAADPLAAAEELQRRFAAVVVLKGATTWIVGQRRYRVVAPSHWAATAGSGDVLAGAIGGLLASSVIDVESTVAGAVWLHAAAAASRGPITARQIATRLPDIIAGVLS